MANILFGKYGGWVKETGTAIVFSPYLGYVSETRPDREAVITIVDSADTVAMAGEVTGAGPISAVFTLVDGADAVSMAGTVSDPPPEMPSRAAVIAITDTADTVAMAGSPVVSGQMIILDAMDSAYPQSVEVVRNPDGTSTAYITAVIPIGGALSELAPSAQDVSDAFWGTTINGTQARNIMSGIADQLRSVGINV